MRLGRHIPQVKIANAIFIGEGLLTVLCGETKIEVGFRDTKFQSEKPLPRSPQSSTMCIV
jgi:hypothetical protein